MDKPRRKYTCWQCHTPGFDESELVGHRCSSCRERRVKAATKGGRFSPYTLEGAKVWKSAGEGSREGMVWKRRKRVLSDEKASSALRRTNQRRMARERAE